MLQHTCRRLVVFTQGFPALQIFAQQKFLASHPLSSSCLWLDEDDFRAVQVSASTFNVANPLRIDPYAHHPQLSRFARAQASLATGQTNKALKTKGAKRTSHNSTAAARPVAAHSAAPQAASAAGAEAPEQLCAVAEGNVIEHDLPFGPESPGDYSDVSALHGVEDATPLLRRRGRSPKDTVAAAKQARQALLAGDVQHYQVPICTLGLTKPLFLFNMNQMYLLSSESVAIPSRAADSLGRDEMDVYDDENRSAFSTWRARPMELAVGEWDFASEVNTPFSRYGQAPMFNETTSLMKPREEHIAEGIRALQLQFPNPTSDQFSTHVGRVMCSVFSRRPYGFQSQRALSILARRHGYRSQWWGTRRQWSSIGAVPQPGQSAHVIPISVLSKVVHISLIEDAAKVLQNCFITAKRRRLVYIFTDPSTQLGRLDSAGDSVGAHGMTYATQLTNLLSRPGASISCFSGGWRFQSLWTSAKEDMRVNKRSLPVYFTLQQLRALKLSLRPDAVGLLQGPTEMTDGHHSRGGSVAVEAERREVSASDGEVTSHGANAAPTELWDGRNLPAAAAKVPTTGSAPKLEWGSAEVLEYWYHISQVHFPDSYLVPSVVLTAELEQPGIPLSGVSGRRLPYRALFYDSLINQRPDVAAAVRRTSVADAEPRIRDAAAEVSRASMEHRGGTTAQGAAPLLESRGGNQDTARLCGYTAAHTTGSSEIKEDEEDLVIARFVATHSSPKLTQGRSLWYQAEDVLAAGGVVDVNSAPVEVTKRPEVVCMGQNTIDDAGILEDGGRSGLPGTVMFNVECLMEPDEALRLLCVPFDPM
ncbi:hypothetical protein CUR178_05462 [Leishmania enriettii]|uniref:Trypanosoma Tc-38 (p38) protein domain-containing protein n=1 Tax=Leishmania enriettii TaxID=5663 RepID=A0A836KLM3_LEIEN|nr:hypothetical protein CUR178_05462 [Leishmania enriettii]